MQNTFDYDNLWLREPEMSKEKPIMCIIGSTKYRDEIKQLAWEKTKKGWLVLLAPFAKEEIPELEQYRELLEQIHFQKIRMSSLVFVFNKDGKIGDHTAEELSYAIDLEKNIEYLEPLGEWIY